MLEVTFLGQKCTDKGILPDNKKFDFILNYPVPHDSDSARRFIEFGNDTSKILSTVLISQ